MKRHVFLAAVLAAQTLACTSSPSQSDIRRGQKSRFETLPPNAVRLDFEDGSVGEPPEGFRLTLTGQGRVGKWLLQEATDAPSGKIVLAQTDGEKREDRFPLCVFEAIRAQDVHVSVRFKAVEGKVGQAAGLVARYRDRDNYYLVRASANEGNVRLFKIVDGKRKHFAGASVPVTDDEWHTLGLELKAERFQVFFDGRPLFEARDTTFADAGMTGVWTQADSVAWFDDLVIASATPK